MITYDELKTALTDISDICRMTNCVECPMCKYEACLLYTFTPNTWFEHLTALDMQRFAERGAHLVEEGYIDE